MKVYIVCQSCMRVLCLPGRDGVWCCSRCGAEIRISGFQLDDGQPRAWRIDTDLQESVLTVWGPIPVGESNDGVS